jgi:hypothetical protein
MHLRQHCSLVLVAIAIAGLPRIVLPAYYREDLRNAAGASTEARSLEVEKEWRAQKFAKLDARSIDSVVARLIAQVPTLNKEQETSLTAELGAVLSYLEHPTFESYMNLRTSATNCTFSPSYSAQKALSSSLPFGSSSPQPSASQNAVPRKFAMDVWRLMVSTNDSAPGLDGLAEDSCVGAITTNSLARLLLKGPTRKGLTVAVEAMNPGFEFRENDSAAAPAPYFEFSFFGRTDAEHVGPVHVSLRWDPDEHTWEPNHLFADKWVNLKILF